MLFNCRHLNVIYSLNLCKLNIEMLLYIYLSMKGLHGCMRVGVCLQQ